MYSLYMRKNVTSMEILKEALKDKYGITEFVVLKNEYGCPYLKDYKDIHFSISNKDEYTICVVSNRKIGVDIEKLTYIPKVAKRCFFDDELEYIEKSSDKERAFTEIWTKKEAYLKMMGIGMRGIMDFDTMKCDKTFDFKLENDYLITVCI